jgi:hypothetical protein
MIVEHDRNETSDLVEFVLLYLEIERLSIVMERELFCGARRVSFVVVELLCHTRLGSRRVVFEFCLMTLFLIACSYSEFGRSRERSIGAAVTNDDSRGTPSSHIHKGLTSL